MTSLERNILKDQIYMMGLNLGLNRGKSSREISALKHMFTG